MGKERSPIWVGAIAGIMSCVPLLFYGPVSLVGRVEIVLFWVCQPGWSIAYLVTGGVHSGRFAWFVPLTSLFSACFWYAVLSAGLLAHRRSRSRRQPVPGELH